MLTYLSVQKDFTPGGAIRRGSSPVANMIAKRRRSLVAGACSHPNGLVLPFRFPMVRTAA